jgi:predicted nucleotidyltransferase
MRVAGKHPDVLHIAYFGSYARGTWGPGSDLDLLVIVESSPRPFIDRPLDFDLTSLPVPAEVLVYTRAEWEALAAQSPRFHAALQRDAVWIYERGNT